MQRRRPTPRAIDARGGLCAELATAHRALDDARALAKIFLRLNEAKLARDRKTSLVHLLDQLGVALALSHFHLFDPDGGVAIRAAGR